MSFAITISSCTNSDDSTNSTSNPIEQKLIGKWYFKDPSTSPSNNNSFTFNTNGKVTYSYWTGTGTSYDSETGTFSTSGDKLTMVFPETVSLTFVQKVVFITEKKVQFIATGNPDEEPYDGTYYKL